MNVILVDLSYTLGMGRSNTFLRLAGNLAGANAPRLNAVFNRILTHIRGKLILSLQGCRTIDSAGLAAFARQRKALAERAVEIVLVDVPAQILTALEGSHLAPLFEIIPSLKEAEAKYGQAAF